MEELTSKQKAIGKLYEAQLLGYDRCELVPSYVANHPRVRYLHARGNPRGPYMRRIPICALTYPNNPLSYRNFTSISFEEAARLIDQGFEFLL